MEYLQDAPPNGLDHGHLHIKNFLTGLCFILLFELCLNLFSKWQFVIVFYTLLIVCYSYIFKFEVHYRLIWLSWSLEVIDHVGRDAMKALLIVLSSLKTKRDEWIAKKSNFEKWRGSIQNQTRVLKFLNLLWYNIIIMLNKS